MRVFIAGATGVLGRRLVTRLTSRGVEVVGLARSPANEASIRSMGGTASRADLFDERAMAHAIEGADIVVHAVTAIPEGFRARFRRAWQVNDRLRREGTRALVTAASLAGARQYLQQSVAWVVRSASPSAFYDEEVLPDPPALVRSAVEGEEIAREIGSRDGLSVGILRGGVFYGPEATRSMMDLIQKGWMPIPGEGAALKAPIHVDDMAGAFLAAADAGIGGIWNVVDDEPVTLSRLLRHLAAVMGAPEPRRIPPWCARLLVGRDTFESLTTPMNTSNAKLRRELGWTPSFPTYREGIEHTVAVWRREGLLPPLEKIL